MEKTLYLSETANINTPGLLKSGVIANINTPDLLKSGVIANPNTPDILVEMIKHVSAHNRKQGCQISNKKNVAGLLN